MWLHNTLSSLNRSHERRLSKAEVAIVKGSNPVRIYDLDSETIKRLMDGFYDPWDLAVDGGTGAFENNPVFKSLKGKDRCLTTLSGSGALFLFLNLNYLRHRFLLILICCPIYH